MLPDLLSYHRTTSVVRAQIEPERLDNLLPKVLTAKPNKALYCSFRSVAMLREGHGSDQTSLTFTRVRRGNHWCARASLSGRGLPKYHWRTRLDNTTNWAVVILGIALSVTFSSREASPLPLLLAGVLSIVFLIFEARRYRYFNVWRARAHWLERNFYFAHMLRGE